MDIVYVFDGGYVDYFKISAKSLLKHNPYANITVVSPEPLKLGENINNIVMESPKLKHNENDRITDATYLKLMLPKLPFDKIIYIDADTIVQDSLIDLWKMDVPYLAMTQSHIAGEKQKEEHGHDKYFLSGVMIMNLKALRKEKFTEKCLEPFIFDGQWQHEETIINHYFYDKITELDVKYNYCRNRRYINSIPECAAVILHYCGDDKSDMEKYANLRKVKDFIRSKTVAIVGNAVSLFDENFGDEIDNHDIVIRFTHGYITNTRAQGTKTDILICAEELEKKRIKQYNPKFIINRRTIMNNGTDLYFTNRDKDKCFLGLGKPASSGLLAVDLCNESEAKKIDLYGFDWERTPTFYNPAGYITSHNYPSEELKIRADYNVNIHGAFTKNLKRITKQDRINLFEAKIIDEMNMPKAEIIIERGKKYKICPKCHWKHSIDEIECRFCGSQL